SAATASAASRFDANARATSLPRLASSSAVALPIPRVAPTMRAFGVVLSIGFPLSTGWVVRGSTSLSSSRYHLGVRDEGEHLSFGGFSEDKKSCEKRSSPGRHVSRDRGGLGKTT